jgi:HupE / UreJ protein
MRCSDFHAYTLRTRFLIASLALGAATAAWAHKASDAYLQVNASGGELTVRVDIALRDLDAALDIDTDGNGRLTWGEVRAGWPAIDAFVTSHLEVDGCALGAPVRALERRTDGVYAALTFSSKCSPGVQPALRYTAFAEIDPTHRGIARISTAGQPDVVRVLDPRASVEMAAAQATGPSSASVAPAATADAPASFGFLSEGVHHIVTGYDHVLFLMCLLFPAVLIRTPSGWKPRRTLREAMWPVLGIVTAFTVAHSITLGLAAMKWVSLPSRIIEPAIAMTIVLAALNNIWPIFRGRVIGVTFAFGLLHGFGFASVLSELNLPAAHFALALLQFNLGLELGQVMIVLVAISLMFLARNRRGYVPWVIRGGSAVAMLIAALWFVERTADVALLPL